MAAGSAKLECKNPGSLIVPLFDSLLIVPRGHDRSIAARAGPSRGVASQPFYLSKECAAARIEPPRLYSKPCAASVGLMLFVTQRRPAGCVQRWAAWPFQHIPTEPARYGTASASLRTGNIAMNRSEFSALAFRLPLAMDLNQRKFLSLTDL
jgi:hypothetical protein